MSKKTEDEINKVFSTADEWFAMHAEHSEHAHKELKKLLEESIPAAKKLDYLLDTEEQKVVVIIYVGPTTILFSNTQKLAANVVEILKECLPSYEVSAKVERFKPNPKKTE